MLKVVFAQIDVLQKARRCILSELVQTRGL